MQFGSLLSWWQWMVLAALPPAVVLLYFLKLKRQPLEVPSTYLWLRSIEDLHVNSIWQRLRRNLLLLLQLLLLLFVALALLRPYWHGSELPGDRFIFLIDNSASMSAEDIAPTRLAEAKRQCGQLIAQMKSGDVAMIVSFSDSARVEQLFTDNRRQLRTRLDDVKATNRSTALAEALRVAAGLANPGRTAFDISDTRVAEALPATLYIFSDGKFADVEGFSLGNLKPIFVPIGQSTVENVAVTALSTRQTPGQIDHLQAFARVENTGPQDVKAEVELLRDGALVDAQSVLVKSHDAASLVFPLAEMHEGAVQLRLKPGGALKLDDEAMAAVNPPQHSKVLLVTPGNEPLELALGTDTSGEIADVTLANPDVLGTKEHERMVASAAYNLVVYDQCAPKQMPQANTLFIGRLPPISTWSAKPKLSGAQIIDVNSAHPLLQLIDLGNVQFAEFMPLSLPPGGTSLIDTSAGVLFGIAPREGFEDAVLGGEIVGPNEKGELMANTDWPIRLSFPVFMMNVLEYLGGVRAQAAVGSTSPGKSVALRSSGAAEKLTVRSPSGKRFELNRGKLSSFNFSDTEELGIYEVREGDKVTQRFAVNLFDGRESDLAPRETVKFGYVEVHGTPAGQDVRQEAWKWLLLVALGVLLFEWYIYNRRVYI